MRWFPMVAFAALFAACLGDPETPPPARTTTTPGAFALEVVAGGLDTPWAVAFSPDGRLFITERPGRIRVVDPEGRLDPEPWAVVPVMERSESGLMGLALHPDFPTTPHVFVVYTYSQSGNHPDTNRLVRYTEHDGRGVDPVVLLDGIPGNLNHDGGRLKVGPDGALWLTTGDAQDADASQDPASLAGKLLRLGLDGGNPADNPDPASLIYSLGHRNAQGLCWHPTTGALYSAEHGPTTDDEVNLIRPGANYGWPVVRGTQERDGYQPSLTAWTPTIAPSGCSFFSDRDGRFPSWENNLFVATLKESDLRRLVLDAEDPTRIVGEEILLDGELGRLRDVVEGPDGYLYVATSNRDGRGSPRDGDDHVYRIVFP